MLSGRRRLFYLVTQSKVDLPCERYYDMQCENGCETDSDCIFCELCNQEHGNTNDGSCANCGEVGIRDV